jgi:hypothetical protein
MFAINRFFPVVKQLRGNRFWKTGPTKFRRKCGSIKQIRLNRHKVEAENDPLEIGSP